MLFHGRSVNSPLVAALAHGPTVYNRQPGRIIWLESRGRNDQHQPAVPGPRSQVLQSAEYGRWPGWHLSASAHSGSLITCTLFTRAAPLLWADYPAAAWRDTRVRPQYPHHHQPHYHHHYHHHHHCQPDQITGVITGTDQGVLWVLYRSVADQILLWIWGWEVARV